MKLLFKQRFFSWLDSYDIYNENGDVEYTVKGELAWGHRLKVYDKHGLEVGTVQEKVLTFLPKFEIYHGDSYVGCIQKEFSFFVPRFHIDYNGWTIEGDFFEWDYHICDSRGQEVAYVTKELFQWTDTYVINVDDPGDAVSALMLVLAIDAEKCSRN